eukprot:m.8603 g.8603  ORF g.8603 m.8603 type:complete len:235 (+) comp20726_c0_seq4:77-781(+)
MSEHFLLLIWGAIMTSSAKCSALVPYSPIQILPFDQPERRFRFCGKEFVLKQRWQETGVAAVVWNASVMMSEWLESGVIDLKGKRVLELGSGTGLAGMVASALGGHVTLTDRALALDLLQMNVDLNRDHLTDPITVSELDWTSDLSQFAGDHGDQWDVILGADLIYDESVFDSLIRTFARFTQKSTTIYLSCKIRYERDLRFINLLEKEFNCSEIFYSANHGVRLYHGTIKNLL